VPSDLALAEQAARAAGAHSRDAFGRAIAAEAKAVPVDPVTAVDRAAEAAVLELLRAQRPDDAVLGEESGAGAGTSGRRWTVDALDGTLNFVSGIPYFCAAVALEDGEGPLAAAIYDPVRDELFSAARGAGAQLDGAPLRIAARTPLAGAVVTTYLHHARPPSRTGAVRVLEAGAQVRILGAGSLELAWVAAGRVDAWAQPTPDPWDWLPGALIVAEAGGAAGALGDPEGWHVAAAPELRDALAGVLT